MQSNAHLSAMLTRTGIGTAHGKIILMGEHAVVYQFPAIALPLPTIQVTATVTSSQASHSLDCHYFQGNLAQVPPHLYNIQAAVRLTQAYCQQAHDSIHLTIESDIPQERGMGSSAAVSVAIVRAICHYYQQTLDDETLHAIVNQAETIAHGTPSGLDTLMTSTATPVLYRKGEQPHIIQQTLKGYLVVADSGQTGKTKEAVHHVRQLAQQDPYFVQNAMEAIGNFTQQAHQAIQQQNITTLGRLMTYNHYYLSQLGISTPQLDAIVKSAWANGALGAKLTGGGLGGCAIALTTTKEMAEKIARAMRQAGAKQTWRVPL